MQVGKAFKIKQKSSDKEEPIHRFSNKSKNKEGIKFQSAQNLLQKKVKLLLFNKKNTHSCLSSLLAYKYNMSQTNLSLVIVENLVQNSNTHLVSLFKDHMIYDYLDEFMKRYYTRSEAKERLPKVANYYKNYLKFFCKPLFRNFKLNDLVQNFGDNKAELYYKKNYGSKNKKGNENDNYDKLFNTTLKENINKFKLGNSRQIQESIKTLNTGTPAKNMENEQIDESSHFLYEDANNSKCSNLLTLRSQDNSLLKMVNSMEEDCIKPEISKKVNNFLKEEKPMKDNPKTNKFHGKSSSITDRVKKIDFPNRVGNRHVQLSSNHLSNPKQPINHKKTTNSKSPYTKGYSSKISEFKSLKVAKPYIYNSKHSKNLYSTDFGNSSKPQNTNSNHPNHLTSSGVAKRPTFSRNERKIMNKNFKSYDTQAFKKMREAKVSSPKYNSKITYEDLGTGRPKEHVFDNDLMKITLSLQMKPKPQLHKKNTRSGHLPKYNQEIVAIQENLNQFLLDSSKKENDKNTLNNINIHINNQISINNANSASKLKHGSDQPNNLGKKEPFTKRFSENNPKTRNKPFATHTELCGTLKVNTKDRQAIRIENQSTFEKNKIFGTFTKALAKNGKIAFMETTKIKNKNKPSYDNIKQYGSKIKSPVFSNEISSRLAFDPLSKHFSKTINPTKTIFSPKAKKPLISGKTSKQFYLSKK